MRVWSLHPAYLDRQGLVACWRETLLAQAVLAGRTRGYRNHSQLVRFRRPADPLATVGAYLVALAAEATERGYRFDVTRIQRPALIHPAVSPPAGVPAPPDGVAGTDTAGASAAGADAAGVPVVRPLTVTDGQVAHEWEHLMAKLAVRSPERHTALRVVTDIEVHPLFVRVPGPVEDWERV